VYFEFDRNIGKYVKDIDINIVGIKYNFGKDSIFKGKYLTAICKIKIKIKIINTIIL
jgi:hypothetical protein